MHPPPEPQPRPRRSSVRRQARLDAETQAKLAELARTFHRKRAAVLRLVMGWGLAHTREWTLDPSIPDRPRLVHVQVDPELLRQVQAAAAAHGADVAAWERHAMRQVTRDDFPASWRAGETAVRSHDSQYYHRPLMLRLDGETSTKLVTLMQTFDRSAAELIRQLIAQANVEDFPLSWRMAMEERRPREARSDA